MWGPSLVLQLCFLLYSPLCLIPLSFPVVPLTGICWNGFDSCPIVIYPVAFLLGRHGKRMFVSDSLCWFFLLSSHTISGVVPEWIPLWNPAAKQCELNICLFLMVGPGASVPLFCLHYRIWLTRSHSCLKKKKKVCPLNWENAHLICPEWVNSASACKQSVRWLTVPRRRLPFYLSLSHRTPRAGVPGTWPIGGSLPSSFPDYEPRKGSLRQQLLLLFLRVS